MNSAIAPATRHNPAVASAGKLKMQNAVTSGTPAPTLETAPAADSAIYTSRKRFLDACACRPVDHAPIWLMRQAGRALPEYRALKKQYSFLELVQSPELAVEVTLQPIRRFGFDAAILFSDILVIAEGLGQKYDFRERGGIEMEFLLESPQDLQRLDVSAVNQRLQYVGRALTSLRSALGDKTALLGFAGSPWTLANFMLEGGGVREYTKAKTLFYTQPLFFNALMEKLTDAIASFLKMQIEAGVDAVQLFDSLGGVLPPDIFAEASAHWMQRIIARLGGKVPVIVFSRGTHGNWPDIAATGATVAGVDWNTRLSDAASLLPNTVAVQGNLDPSVLTTSPEITAARTTRLLEAMRGRPGHIFNLGHGVPPDARLECIESLVTTVRNFK